MFPPNLPLHGDQHPPGQAYWSFAGTLWFGKNLLGYRFSSVLLGTAAVFLAFLLGRSLAGDRGGLVAAFLFASNEYLIHVSALCTEKNYLVWALFSLYALKSITERATTPRFACLGAALGLGCLTKQTLALWVPAFALVLRFSIGRGAFRRPGPWVALALMILLVSPDLVWNAMRAAAPADESLSSRGLGFQLSRLEAGNWSWGPLAMYIRPLFYNRIEHAISEYASMTTWPGAVVLLGAAASLFVLRDAWSRLLQALGFGTFLFFSFLSSPRGEFWWSDLSLLAFLLLTAAVVARLPGLPRVAALTFGGALFAFAGGRVAATSDNYFPLDWGGPPEIAIEQYRNGQKFLFLQDRQRDLAALCSVRGRRLPAASYYEDALNTYSGYLDDLGAGRAPADAVLRGFPRVEPEHLDRERAWVAERVARWRAHGGDDA